MKSISNIDLSEKIDLEKLKNTISKSENKHKSKILTFLKNPDFISACSTEKVFDVFLDKSIEIPISAYESEKYYWDDRDIYYFEKYNLNLNGEFIEYVLKYS